MVNFKIDERDNSKVVIVDSVDKCISSVGDALDLMSSIRYNYDCDKMIIKKENIVDDFFELRTKLAGEIIQKYTNYSFKMAILGDFNVYNSKSLNDFIYECNKGNQLLFSDDLEESLDRLHKV